MVEGRILPNIQSVWYFVYGELLLPIFVGGVFVDVWCGIVSRGCLGRMWLGLGVWFGLWRLGGYGGCLLLLEYSLYYYTISPSNIYMF